MDVCVTHVFHVLITSQGWLRKGVALGLMEKWEEATMAFLEGVSIDPTNETIRGALKEAKSHLTGKHFGIWCNKLRDLLFMFLCLAMPPVDLCQKFLCGDFFGTNIRISFSKFLNENYGFFILGGKDQPLVMPFADPKLFEKILNHPKTRGYLKDTEYMHMVQEIQRDPNKLS